MSPAELTFLDQHFTALTVLTYIGIATWFALRLLHLAVASGR